MDEKDLQSRSPTDAAVPSEVIRHKTQLWNWVDIRSWIAVLISFAGFGLSCYKDVLYREPEVHRLTATVSGFNYVKTESDTTLVADILFHNRGNRPEIVREVVFSLPFYPKGGNMMQKFTISGGATFSATGVGASWPLDSRRKLTNIRLDSGDIQLRQLHQPMTEAQLTHFLRLNQSSLEKSPQEVILEITSLAAAGEPITKKISVAFFGLDRQWSLADVRPVDLLTRTDVWPIATGNITGRVEIDSGAVR